MSIKTKVAIILVLFMVLPLFFFSVVSLSQLRQQIIIDAHNNLETIASSQVRLIEQLIENIENNVISITSRTKFRELLSEYKENGSTNLQQLEKIVADAINPIDRHVGVWVLDTEENSLVVYDKGVDYREDMYKEVNALITDGTITEKSLHTITELKLLVTQSDIVSNDGELLGTLLLAVENNIVKEITSSYTGLGDTGEVLVGTRNDVGDAIFINTRRFEDSNESLKVISRHSKNIPIINALDGVSKFIYQNKDYRGEEVLSFIRYIPELDWGIVVKIDHDEVFASLYKEVLLVWTIILTIIILGILFSYVITGPIIEPIIALSNLTKKIAAGNLKVDIKSLIKRTDGEISELAKSFDQMTTNLSDLYSSLEQKVEERTKELRSSEQKFKNLYEESPIGIAQVSLEGKWLDVNNALEEIIGYPEAELKEKTFQDITHPDDLEIDLTNVRELIDGKKDVYQIDKRYYKKNGELIWVQLNVSIVRDDNHQPLYFISQIQDITKRKERESQLQRFKLAVDEATTPMIMTNTDGEIVYINKAWTKLNGYTAEEAIGQNPKILKSGQTDKAVYDEMWKSLKTGKPFLTDDLINKTKTGRIYKSKLHVFPILDKESKKTSFYVGIVEDITKEKEIDQAKTEFVSLASHQLRTPLSSINWYAEMLLDGDVGKLNKGQKDYINQIYDGNQRMVSLVNALLDVSRLELGTFIVQPTKVDLKTIIAPMFREVKTRADEHKIKMSLKYDKDIPKLNLDARLMGMVVQNLLSNAVKYTENGGKVEMDVSLNKKEVIIKISDNGYGIPEHQKDKIFTKLFRADNVTALDTEGTGLGLYIVKQIVDHSGGKVWFESKESKGTTFYVSLPISGMKAKDGNRQLGS